MSISWYDYAVYSSQDKWYRQNSEVFQKQMDDFDHKTVYSKAFDVTKGAFDIVGSSTIGMSTLATVVHLTTTRIEEVDGGPLNKVGLHFGSTFDWPPSKLDTVGTTLELQITGYAFGPTDHIRVEIWVSLVSGPYSRVIFDEHGAAPAVFGLQFVRGKLWAVEEDRSAFFQFHAYPTRSLAPIRVVMPCVVQWGEDRGRPPSYTYPYGIRQPDSRYLVTYSIGTSSGVFQEVKGEGRLLRSYSDPCISGGKASLGPSRCSETQPGKAIGPMEGDSEGVWALFRGLWR